MEEFSRVFAWNIKEDSMHGDKRRSGIISRVSYYWEGSSTTAWIPLNRLCSRYSSEIRLFSPTQIRCVTVDPLVLLPFEDDFPLELILLCLCLFYQMWKRRKNTKKRRSEVRKILFRKKFAVNKNFYSFISFRYFLKRLDNLRRPFRNSTETGLLDEEGGREKKRRVIHAPLNRSSRLRETDVKGEWQVATSGLCQPWYTPKAFSSQIFVVPYPSHPPTN